MPTNWHCYNGKTGKDVAGTRTSVVERGHVHAVREMLPVLGEQAVAAQLAGNRHATPRANLSPDAPRNCQPRVACHAWASKAVGGLGYKGASSRAHAPVYDLAHGDEFPDGPCLWYCNCHSRGQTR